MKVETKELQKMLGKVMKGVINNKIIPITSLIGIKYLDGELSITAFDEYNYIQVFIDNVSGEDLEVTIPAYLFNNLIQKMTCKEIDITMDDSVLHIKGNGKYKIELPIDETGDLISYPEIPEVEPKESGVIKKTTIDSMLNVNKACLAKNEAQKCFRGYHVSKGNVITGDTRIAAVNPKKIFKDSYLFCPEALELLSVIEDKEIEYERNEDIILFKSDNVYIYTVEQEDEEKFPYKEIKEFFNNLEELQSCTLNKSEILGVLDRVSLFVNEMDESAIELVFDVKGVSIKSKQNTGAEVIQYKEKKKKNKPFSCIVNLNQLRTIISIQTEDDFDLYYGDSSCLKVVSKDIKFLISLVEEDLSSVDIVDTKDEDEELDDETVDEDIPF
jgi:DNA polymerase III sliding clamp (beta) subunit (PCNA family)